MRWTTTFPTLLLLLLLTGPEVAGQEEPNPDRRPPVEENPGRDWRQERKNQPGPEGDEPERPGADGAVREPGAPRTEVVLPGGESLNVEVFTDPEPLPRGGEGTLFLKINLQDKTFLTRGPGETRVHLPAQAGVLKLGDPLWPAATGNYTHPGNGASVPGWTGLFFIKVPITVAPHAPFAPVDLSFSINYKLMSTDRPRRSGPALEEKIKTSLKVGPLLPDIVFPVQEKGGKRLPAPGAGEGRLKPPPGTGPAGGGREGAPGTGRLRETRPGKSTERGPEELDPPLEEMDGGTLFSDPLVAFGLAGVLLIGALLLLFRRR